MTALDPKLLEKENRLLTELNAYDRIAVAYSGGVDSSYLADVAHDALGDRAEIIIADSPSIPRSELNAAVELATDRGWNLKVIQTREHLNPAYLENKGDRCFHCKNELFRTMEEALCEVGSTVLAHGAIEDDKGDIRPGTKAAADHQVIAPLQNAGLFKTDVRQLSARRGLPTAEKASFACLGSRFPTGTRIELKAMSQVEQAEEILRRADFVQYRVRHHGDLCRIEIDPSDFDTLLARREELVQQLTATGYRYVTLDLSGYRTGSSA